MFLFGIGYLVNAFSKFFDELTDASAHLRQPLGSKDEEGNNKNDDQFRGVKSKHDRYPFLTCVSYVCLLATEHYDKRTMMSSSTGGSPSWKSFLSDILTGQSRFQRLQAIQTNIQSVKANPGRSSSE